MAQKTILSFFKSHELSNDQTVQPTKSRKNKRTDKIIKSEAKQEKTVKRTKRSRQIIESDEEDIVNGENSSLNESVEGKQLDTESNDEKSNCQSQDNSSKEAKKEEHIKEDEQSSEVIPKRLTARKHMKRKLKTEITQANSVEYRSVKKRKSDISNDRKAENSDNETMETNEQISTKELVSNEISNERNGQISSENSENSSLDDSGEKKTLKAKQKRKTAKQNIDKPTKKQQKKVFKKNSKDDVSETTKKVSPEDSENSSVDDSGENKMLKAKSKQKKNIAKQNIDKPAKKEQKNIFEKNLKDNVSKIIKKVSSEYSENSSLDDSGENKTLKKKSKQKKKPAKQDIDKPAKKQQKKVFEKNLKNNASETTKKVEETKNVSINKGKQKNAGKKPKNEGDESSINETKVNVEEHQESSTEDIINDKSENTEEESRTKIKAEKIKESAECQTKKPVHSFFAPRKKKVQENSNTESEKDGKESPKDSKIINSHSAQNDSSSYNPSKHHYHPIDEATWKKGEKVPYLALARTLEEIENISARLKMIEILANFFRSVIVLAPEDLLCSVYLCLNKVAPEYEGIEMGVGDTVLMKAVAQATGRTVEKIKAEVTVKGDLGLVAESSRGNQRVMFAPPKLTVSAVFSKFKEIAQMAGNAVMSKKIDKIQALFVACRNCEARYIIRSLSGKLRIGLAEQSVLAALAQAAVLTPPNQPYPPQILNSSSSLPAETFKKKLEPQTVILKTTYCECPNYDLIIPVLLKEGIDGLPNHCHLTAGIPLKPMLAHPTKGIDEVLRRFDNIEFTCEFKYDGERAQIHTLENGDVKIYSRNQENNTSKYPDIISRIPKILKPETKSCIIDSEAVAWDAESKQILPFQVLSTRKRKDAVESEITVQVCIVAFDLLYLNGESLVKYPLIKRRELLHQSFTEIENEFMFVQSADGKTAETMQEFLEESIKGNCEGLMVKSLEVDASYEIAKRSHNWLKLKKDYLEGVGDTLDVVVIGGYHGKGKRTGTYGGFLLACYDNENEEFQSICKIGTGFKDEELEAHTTFLKQHVINEPKSYYRFDSSLKPDEWVEPVQVWEIKCADLSKSPVHKAAIGIVDPEKGISLRFPRFIRIREDKKPEDATTASQVAQMYNSQEQVQNQKMKDTKQDDDEEFY